MYIRRTLALDKLKKSIFLLGPRQTGKSSLLKHAYPHIKKINLLKTDELLKYSTQPSLLRKELTATDLIVAIDEIQKLPILLDEVQYLIDEYNIKFILTGSSARKLRKNGINLLGGRANSYHLHPFTYSEMGADFNILDSLSYGTLPPIYFSDSPRKDLKSYVGDYLQQEIIAEGASRNIPAFSRFLEASALLNGQMINYQKIADHSSVAKSTVIEYYKILKDTLIAFEVLPWQKSIIRKPIQTSKYYFFDIGVARSLQKRDKIKLSSPDLGDAFECWMAHELKSFLDYKSDGDELYYWRSTSQYEVDFILNDSLAIEVKAKNKFSKADFKGLIALSEEKLLDSYIMVGMHDKPYQEGPILVLPWKDFLNKLYSGSGFKKL